MGGYDAIIEVLPPIGMLDLRGKAAVRLACENTLGLRFPQAANTMISGPENLIVYCVSPDHWIAQVEDGCEDALLRSLEHAAAGLPHSFVDVSDMYCQIRLSGAEARHVLAQGISIDIHLRVFPPGSTARTRFAKTTAQLYCVDDTPTYIITVYSSYRQYAVDWLRVALGVT